jgi:transposase
MPHTPDSVPDDVDALKAALAEARAKLSGAVALIAHLQLQIAKLRREHFGPRSERSQRLLDQMELQLEELVAAAGEDEAGAETAGVQVQGFTRRQARAGTSPPTCRDGAWFTRHRLRALAAAAQNSPGSARTSPRRSTWCRGNGS